MASVPSQASPHKQAIVHGFTLIFEQIWELLSRNWGGGGFRDWQLKRIIQKYWTIWRGEKSFLYLIKLVL